MQLRPLGVGEVLDAGFRLVRSRFSTLLLCALAVAVPLAVLRTVVLAATVDNAFDTTTSANTHDNGALAGALATAAIGILLVLLVLAACFRAISAAYLGQRASAGDSLAFAMRRLPELLGVYLLVAISVGIGFVVLVVPGIYLAVALSVALPALLFERIGPSEAYSRSFALVRGNWWRTFGVLVVTVLIYWAISLFAGVVAGALAPDSDTLTAVIVTVLDIVLATVLYPLIAGILTVLYYDLRVRSEGFDRERLAQGVGGSPEPEAEPEPERRAPPGWAPPRPSLGAPAEDPRAPEQRRLSP